MESINVREYIEKHGLCKDICETCGIYAITIDKHVVYVGQARNMIKRVKRHFWHVLNIPVRHKYVLLKQAEAEKRKIDCIVLKNCKINELKELENRYILLYQFNDDTDEKIKNRKCPPLNNLWFENLQSYPYEKFIGNLSKFMLHEELS